MSAASDERQPRIGEWIRGLLHELPAHLLGHAVFASFGLALGVLLLSSGTFNNTTYMKTGDAVGSDPFQPKLLLVRIESHVPMCSFRAGPPNEPPLGILRGGQGRIGGYEIDVLECDSDRKFAVVRVHLIGSFRSSISYL